MTPYVNSAAQAPVAVDAPATGARITGLTNGTGYTFRVAATNGAGTGSASAATSAVTPRSSIFESAAPSIVDARRHGLGRGRRQVQLERGRLDHRPAVLQGEREHRVARGIALVLDRHAAGARDRSSNETSSGWQAVTFDTPVPITASTTYVASYLAPNGHYSVTPGRSRRRSRTRR